MTIERGNKLILILGVVIAVFFSFWKINEFPRDVNGEVIIYVNSLRCLQSAHTEPITPQACFQKLYNRWESKGITFKNYEVTAFAQKIWLFILSIIFNIYGYSIFSITLASSLTGLIAIFFTYRIGKLLYSEAVGILAGVFFSTSIIHNIMSRSGYGFDIITSVSLVVFYYLYKYLESKEGGYLIITGILLGIGSLDALPHFFFIPASVILILLFDSISKEKSKIKVIIGNFKKIAVILVWALAASLVLTCIYSWYYNTSVFSIYEIVFTFINQKFHGAEFTHQYVAKGAMESLRYAGLLIKNTFIGMSAPDLDDYALQLERIPMVTPLVSLSFIAGLFFIFRDHSKANRLLLFWLAINFIAYMFFIRVQTRYVAIFLPAVCLVSSYAVSKGIGKIRAGRYSSTIRQLIYFGIILIVTYTGYRNFFVSYRDNDANLRRFYNNSRIAQFVVHNSKPEDCLIVLAENLFSCRDAVIFNMQYKPYKVLYLEEILYNKAQGSDKRQISLEEAKDAIRELESQALKDNKVVYYIFSEHSIDYYFGAMVPAGSYSYVQMFKGIYLSLHPNDKPVEILHYSNGDPTHSIFMVTR